MKTQPTNNEIEIVPVPLSGREYDIEIGRHILETAGDRIASFGKVSSCIILTDENVRKYEYAQRVASSISEAGLDVVLLSIQPGEASKQIETAASLWLAMVEEKIDRQSVLVAVGGGVVGDLGGFVAATFARGIRFFQVPTTLLAQVDSSVGGKVGVDLPTAKNMVGAFHQPIGVIIDTETLQTLPDEQYASGLGEVVKYAVSLDRSLFEFLEQHVTAIKKRDQEILRKIVAECCRIKTRIVLEDEFEKHGRRVLLNYGHTFGHAFETQSQFTMLHGHAVASGMIAAAKFSQHLGLIDSHFLDRQIELHRALGLPTDWPPDCHANEIIDLMQRDKKTEFGKLRLVLPTGLGECRVVEDVSPDDLLAANLVASG